MNNNDKRNKLYAPGWIGPKDIEKAVRKDLNNCALAQAFKRVNPGAEVIVNLSEGMVWVNGLASTIGPSILQRLKAFDDGHDLEPFSMESIHPESTEEKQRVAAANRNPVCAR